MNAFAKGLLAGLLAGLLLFYGASLLPGKKTVRIAQPVQAPDTVLHEEMLSVKGENALLKKMLGQVEGEVLILGPAGKKSAVHGKLVWDMPMQQGFLHAEDLDPALAYQLVLKTKQGAAVVVAECAGQQVWQIQFKTPQRILDLVSVEIRGGSSRPETEMVYARGVVSGK